MGVTLSLKNVPEELAALLKRQAEANHRSMQGELMAIVEAALTAPRRMTPLEVLAEIRKLGLNSPSESAAMIRELRDSR